MAAGNLASDDNLAILDASPAATHAQVQQEILGDYLARRSTAIDQEWHSLGRRDRRRTSREQLVDAYDAEHLLGCDTCTLAYENVPANETGSDRCSHCDGALLDWPNRTTVVPLVERLDAVRSRTAT